MPWTSNWHWPARRAFIIAAISGVCLMPIATSAQEGRGRRTPGAQVVAIEAATIFTGGRDGVIPGGNLTISRGKIGSVGLRPVPEAMRDRARVINAKGMYVTPGLIDVWTDLGVSPGGPSQIGGAANRAVDGLNGFDKTPFEYALRQGVTAICIEPSGARGVIGTAALVRLENLGDLNATTTSPVALIARLGASGGSPLARLSEYNALRKVFEDARAYRESWETYQEELEKYIKDLKAGKAGKIEEDKATPQTPRPPAPEEGPRRGQGRRPGPRPRPRPPSDDSIDAYIEWVREWDAFQLSLLINCCDEDHPERPCPEEADGTGDDHGVTAVESPDDGFADEPTPTTKPDEKKEDGKDEAKKPAQPNHDANMEVVVKALKRELPVRIEVHRPADILNVLELIREFNLDATLEGVSGGGLVARELGISEARVILSRFIPSALFQNDAYRDLNDDNVARLRRAGVELLVGSGMGGGSNTHYLRHNAALAVAAGMPADEALAAITIRAARACGAAETIGSIERGKLADVVIWSGPPLSSDSRVEYVFVGGKEVYRRGR